MELIESHDFAEATLKQIESGAGARAIIGTIDFEVFVSRTKNRWML